MRPVVTEWPVVTMKKLKILDFDIETRKVGFFQAGKFGPDGCEPIAIAASWIGGREVRVKLQPEYSVPELIEWFRELYDQADIITGHYIRRFDLPIISAMTLEFGLEKLGPKRTQDTKLDMIAKGGLAANQENLAGMWDLAESKFHMGDFHWREGTRLTPDGIELTRRRVVDDVKQHKHLYQHMVAEGYLKDPKVWRP